MKHPGNICMDRYDLPFLIMGIVNGIKWGKNHRFFPTF